MAKRKGTNNEQQNITHKTKDDREIRTPLKPGSESRFSGRVTSSCCTSGTRRVNLVKNPVISHKWGKDREVFSTSWTYLWSFVTQIFHNGQPIYGGDRKTFEVMTSTYPIGTLGSVTSLLAATLYPGNPDRNHWLWNDVSTERDILHIQVPLECCYILMKVYNGKIEIISFVVKFSF
jgi:hypothetical protein